MFILHGRRFWARAQTSKSVFTLPEESVYNSVWCAGTSFVHVYFDWMLAFPVASTKTHTLVCTTQTQAILFDFGQERNIAINSKYNNNNK